jgi:predicted DNA-binding protein
MRIQVDLEERERRALHALSKSLGVRSDVLVKEAIREFLHRNGQASNSASTSTTKIGPGPVAPLNG